MTTDALWYKDAIIYQLHVRTFCDGNADGIGDFTGLIQKLDYVQSLGVTAVWLLPFYESPLRDDGYDIAHYERIDRRYGTMEDFTTFLAKALDIIEFLDEADEVADPVCVAVAERSDVQLVADGVFVPERVGGHRGSRQRSGRSATRCRSSVSICR